MYIFYPVWTLSLPLHWLFYVQGVQVELSKVWVCKCVRPWGDVYHHMTGRIAQTLQTVRKYKLTFDIFNHNAFSIAPLLLPF